MSVCLPLNFHLQPKWRSTNFRHGSFTVALVRAMLLIRWWWLCRNVSEYFGELPCVQFQEDKQFIRCCNRSRVKVIFGVQ